MASTKSEKTLDEAEKAVQARQDAPEPFDQQVLRDRCKYIFFILILFTCIYLLIVEEYYKKYSK